MGLFNYRLSEICVLITRGLEKHRVLYYAEVKESTCVRTFKDISFSNTVT